MFGYIKPVKGEMLVRHYELYQALYCGLCDTIRKEVSPALTLALNYDFVFLALIRALAGDEVFQVRKKRCGMHPFKKRGHILPGESLRFSARAALLLTYENLLDDLRDPDTSFWKKLILRPYAAFLKHDRNKLLKKQPQFSALCDLLRDRLEKMDKLEQEKSSDLDALCILFGDLMAGLSSFGLEGQERLICREIGDYTGRLIYTVDACDDLEKDEKSGSFNPLLQRYGSVEKAKEAFVQLDVVLSLYASRMDAALGLFATQKDYMGIARNITARGLGALYRSILNPENRQCEPYQHTKGEAENPQENQ